MQEQTDNKLTKVIVILGLGLGIACYFDWLIKRDDETLAMLRCGASQSREQYEECARLITRDR